MKIKTFINFIFVLILSFPSFAQDSKSLLNKPAPDLNFTKIINYEKPDAQSADFKSKILIVDLWATWCALCSGIYLQSQ